MSTMERDRKRKQKPTTRAKPTMPGEAAEATAEPPERVIAPAGPGDAPLAPVPAPVPIAPAVIARGPAPRTLVQLAGSSPVKPPASIEEMLGEQVERELEALDPIELDVLNAARDSLKKKRFEADIEFSPYTPMVEKIVGDCLAKYHAQKGYSKAGIIDAIKALEAKRFIITAERRTRDEILGSDLHKAILAFIGKHPGVHARDERVQRDLGITRNPFLKHLLVLERFELVKKRQHGKLWNYFLASFPDDERVMETVVLLYNGVARQLLSLVLQDPGSSLVELARRVIPPVFHGAIQYHLKKFEDVGLVTVVDGKRVVDMNLLTAYNLNVPVEFQLS